MLDKSMDTQKNGLEARPLGSSEQGAPRPRSPLGRLPSRIHLLGAGGAGMSGAARLLAAHGHVLSGHDRAESEHVRLLRSLGVAIEISPMEQARLPQGVELVIRSAAVPTDTPALREAAERGVQVLKYAEALGRVTPFGRTLAVAGTHGKTTTSWMLYHALRGLCDSEPAGVLARPGAIVGGVCCRVGANAVVNDEDGWFSVEACEYDRSFLNLSPHGAIITNVEADHLDYFGDMEAIKSAFSRFVDRLPLVGLLVAGPQLPRSVEQAARCAVWRLGRELRVSLRSERNGFFTFSLEGPDFRVRDVTLAVPGQFNVDNAACAIGLAVGLVGREWRIAPSEAAYHAARGIEAYLGSQRRFERWGTPGGMQLVHDYAHHPTEVKVTLETARRVYPGRRLHVLFQPHQHSRTARFMDGFADSLRMADRVVVADVYGARTHIDGEVTAGSAELVERLRAAGVDAVEGGGCRDSARALAAGMERDSAVLVLGAGDIVDFKDDLIDQLARCRAARGGSS